MIMYNIIINLLLIYVNYVNILFIFTSQKIKDATATTVDILVWVLFIVNFTPKN